MEPLSSPPTSKTPRGAAPFPTGKGAAPRGRLKRFFWAAFALGVGVWLWGWLSVDESGQLVTQTSDEPQAEIVGLQSFLFRRDGQPLWEISARRASLAADGTSTLITGVERALLYRGGQPFLHLSAPRARFSNASSDLEASGGVSATGPDRFSFQTARALWRSATQTVDCPKPVTAWLRDFYFQAPRLSYNWDRGVLSCAQEVEVRTEGAVFRGKNLEATLKTRQIKLSGGVHFIFAPGAVRKVMASPKKTAR